MSSNLIIVTLYASWYRQQISRGREDRSFFECGTILLVWILASAFRLPG
jgi:hypothetical protein